MSSATRARAVNSRAKIAHVHLRLFIAGNARHSTNALANLRALVRAHIPNLHRLEVVDVLCDPARAVSDGVLLTPMLIRVSPPPIRRIVGDLSDSTTVLSALGLEL